MGSIMIPKKIKVGFQEREDTYTGQLAYVIYYDEKNKLRKETSWEGWRDEKIEAQDFDNVPTTGFVLNKKVGGYKSGWDIRQTYVRIYDPRNFEFEITIPNLLYILENANSIKGKGLEGNFVYGWDGKDLILIPADAPEYQEIMTATAKVYDQGEIKAKDLVVGNTYGDLNNNGYVYLGKYFYYVYDYQSKIYINNNNYRGCYYSRGLEGRGYYKDSTDDAYWQYQLTDEWKIDKYKGTDTRIKTRKKPKVFWFYDINSGWITTFNNLTKKFYSVIDNNVCSDYARYFDLLEHNKNYSPINLDATNIEYMSFEEFEEKCLNIKNYHDFYYFKNEKEGIEYISVYNKNRHNATQNGEFQLTYSSYNSRDTDVASIKDLYNELKPIKNKIITLENGNIIKENPSSYLY